MFRYSIFYILLFCSFFSFAQSGNLQQKLDSIESLRKLSRDRNLDVENRLEYALNASNLSNETKIDSTILRSNIILSYMYQDMDNGKLEKDINLKIYSLQQK